MEIFLTVSNRLATEEEVAFIIGLVKASHSGHGKLREFVENCDQLTITGQWSDCPSLSPGCSGGFEGEATHAVFGVVANSSCSGWGLSEKVKEIFTTLESSDLWIDKSRAIAGKEFTCHINFIGSDVYLFFPRLESTSVVQVKLLDGYHEAHPVDGCVMISNTKGPILRVLVDGWDDLGK